MRKKFFLKKTIYKPKFKNTISNPPTNIDNVFYFFSGKNSKITQKQLDKFILILKLVSRLQKKKYKQKIRFFLYLSPIWFGTKKALGVRMGKGKGNKGVSFCRVSKGFLFLKVYHIISFNSFSLLKRVFSFFQFKTYFFFFFNKQKEELFIKNRVSTKKREIK